MNEKTIVLWNWKAGIPPQTPAEKRLLIVSALFVAFALIFREHWGYKIFIAMVFLGPYVIPMLRGIFAYPRLCMDEYEVCYKRNGKKVSSMRWDDITAYGYMDTIQYGKKLYFCTCSRDNVLKYYRKQFLRKSFRQTPPTTPEEAWEQALLFFYQHQSSTHLDSFRVYPMKRKWELYIQDYAPVPYRDRFCVLRDPFRR